MLEAWRQCNIYNHMWWQFDFCTSSHLKVVALPFVVWKLTSCLYAIYDSAGLLYILSDLSYALCVLFLWQIYSASHLLYFDKFCSYFPWKKATRHARRVYIGGLPPLANEQVCVLCVLVKWTTYIRIRLLSIMKCIVSSVMVDEKFNQISMLCGVCRNVCFRN